MQLPGKVVLVTGAAHGIGRATADAFAEKGCRVAYADLDAAAAKEAASNNSEATSYEVDVASEDSFNLLVDSVIKDFGGLDVLVGNAGVSVSGPIEAVSLEDWRWVVDVNMWPHVFAARKLIPYFKQRGSGHFVHVSSAGGILGTPGLAAYCMTKFAVFGLAESMAVSLDGTGVDVSVVCPLWVDTDIVSRGRTAVDPELGVDEASMTQLARELLRTQGIPPAKVAEAIVEAVEEGRFLVLPHPEVLGFAQAKWADPNAYISRAAQVMNTQRQLFENAGSEYHH